MNRSLANSKDKPLVAGTIFTICPRLLMIGVAAIAATIPTFAQNAELQQKLAAVKQVIALNKQSLQTISVDRDHATKPEWRAEAANSELVSVRSWRASSEDSHRSSSRTTQRWQAQAKSH